MNIYNEEKRESACELYKEACMASAVRILGMDSRVSGGDAVDYFVSTHDLSTLELRETQLHLAIKVRVMRIALRILLSSCVDHPEHKAVKSKYDRFYRNLNGDYIWRLLPSVIKSLSFDRGNRDMIRRGVDVLLNDSIIVYENSFNTKYNIGGKYRKCRHAFNGIELYLNFDYDMAK